MASAATAPMPKSASAAAAARRDDPGRNAEEQRHQQRGQPERDAHRQSLADELAHREVALPQRGTEVPAQQPADVTQVLHRQRPVEAVEPLEVGAHRSCERLLLVEGPARGQSHDEERQRDDGEQRGEEPRDATEREL